MSDCPRCGEPHESGQEYCLECGLRLPGGGSATRVESGWRRRFPGESGSWLLPVLLGAVIAVAGGAIAVAYANDGSSSAVQVATTDVGTATPPPAATDTGATAPQSSVAITIDTNAATITTPSPSTSTAATPTKPAPPKILTAWPGKTGYTVVLESLPKNAGRPQATAKAKSALKAGLPQVGVLDSGRYASLHPGYLVVFSGVYHALADAQAAVSGAQAKGFRAAYARQITS